MGKKNTKLEDTKQEERDYQSIVNGADKSISTLKFEINKIITSDIKVEAKNDSQKKIIKSIKSNEVTICSGFAGTGKTYVALGIALDLLRKANTPYRRIYLLKSVTPLKGEEVGFLKGGIEEKIDPFMWSFNLNITKLIPEKAFKSLTDANFIKAVPLTYLRGTTLDDCIMILDETQNVAIKNVRTAMTRIGTNCKLIMLGDVDQIDLKNETESALKPIIDMFGDTPSIGVIEMDVNDKNVRNPLIALIEAKFKEYFNKTNKK